MPLTVYRVVAFYLEKRSEVDAWLQAEDEALEHFLDHSGAAERTRQLRQTLRERLDRHAAT